MKTQSSFMNYKGWTGKLTWCGVGRWSFFASRPGGGIIELHHEYPTTAEAEAAFRRLVDGQRRLTKERYGAL